MPARMLVLHHGDFSGITPALLEAWRDAGAVIPIPIDLVSVTLGGRKNPVQAVPAAWRALGFGLLTRGYGGLRGAVKRSAWYAEQLRDAVDRVATLEQHDFILTMQSLVPVTRPSRPHFVFTDHTVLSNLAYPDGAAAAERWKEYLPYERRTLEAATAVFTMSQHVRESVIAHYGVSPSNVFCVGGGTNAPYDDSLAPADRYHRQNIVFVGFEWERKGGPELLKAFTAVRRTLPHATLTIVGASPAASSEGVEIVGPVSADAVGYHLGRASVFCMPSHREPFGVAYLEAMRAALPVVALRQGAVTDFVTDGDTGFLVPSGDVDALADRLCRLLANPTECRAMGNRARVRVETEYTWSQVQQRMWKVISTRLTPG